MPNEIELHTSVFELQQKVSLHNSSSAFEQLYLLFYKGLHHFAYRIIRSNHIAEEIVSDVFVQLWKKRGDISNIKNLRVFLYVAVKNQSLTYLYKSKKQRVSWIDEFAGGSDLVSANSTPEELLHAKELTLQINHAVNNLPLKCKAVFKLVKESGLKYCEAALVLNLSQKTIENQMGIALKKIAAVLRQNEYLKGEVT